MPAPAVLLVAAGITAVASNPIFIRFVYDPLIAPTLERLAGNYIEQRRARSRRPAPVDGLPQPGADDGNDNDIPLNGMRRSLFTCPCISYATEDENGDDELDLLMVQSSATARITDENAGANMTLCRRPVSSVRVVDNTIFEESSLLFGVQRSTTPRAHNEIDDVNAIVHKSAVAVHVVDNIVYEESSFLPVVQNSTTAQEPGENVDADTTLHRGPAAPVLIDNTTLEELSLLLGTQGSTTGREPNVNENINSTSTLCCRRPVSIDNSNNYCAGFKRTTFAPAQGKKLRPEPAVAVSGLSLPTIPEWKTTVSQNPSRLQEERGRKVQVQWTSSVMDRPLLPTSVPSTLSSTTPDMVFTPPSWVPPLFSASINTGTGANGANPSETGVLDPWNGVSSSLPPRLPPLPTFSPLCVPSMSLSLFTHSTYSNQLTSSISPHELNAPPHSTLSAEHLHCGHFPAPHNITTVASSEIYQQHRFASPGVMSSELSELNFISE